MKEMVYYNGETREIGAALIPAEDRGYQFADGIYEVILVVNGRPFAMDEHMARLEASLRFVSIDMPMPRAKLEAEILAFIAGAEPCRSQLLYLSVTRGTAPRAQAGPEGIRPNLLMTIKPNPALSRDPAAPIVTISAPDIRWQWCHVKSIGLTPTALFSTRAREQGAGEVIYHKNGRVTEGGASNAWIVKNGVLITPPLSEEILPGVTRAHLLSLAEGLGIKVELRSFTLEEMISAQEALLSSTNRRPAAIGRLDGAAIAGGGEGPVTRALRDAYRALVLKQCGMDM